MIPLSSTPETSVKIICTRQNENGSYDEVGMKNRCFTSKYATTSGFIRYGIPSQFYGNRIRVQVWYGENIYRQSDKVIYMSI